MALLLAAVLLSVVMSAAWWWQRRTGNAGWVDAFWTFGLGVAGVITALAGGSGPRSWVVAAAVAIWSARLGLYIVARSRRGPEDARYAQFRQDWGTAFQRRMFGFLQIQALAAAMLLVPVFAATRSARPLDWADGLALLIVAIAVAGEARADAEMHAFRRAHHGGVCDTGLWALSRHPNYFFEWLHWFAYPLFAFGSFWAFVALFGPALMYWLLVYVSGIPPLEQQMLRSRGEAYRAYQRRVPAFFPGIRRSPA